MMREILVLDCEEDGAFWIGLKTAWKIHFADTAEEGLKLLSESIGIVFINVRLADMSGIEALGIIKNEYPSMDVIMVASCGAGEACRCMEAFRKGAWEYMKKPLRAEEVVLKINTLLNRKNISTGQSFSPVASPHRQYPNIPSHLVRRILRVKDYLEQNHSESLTLAAACRMATISKTYFCRFFKSITGHSLRSYNNLVKVKIAEELLRDKRLSVADVAMRLGYDDPNYFSTIYKKMTGVSPRCRKAAGESSRNITPGAKGPTDKFDHSDWRQTC